MGGWGRHNPWPLQWGGGPSDFEQLWSMLRAALGDGGAGPVEGLEDAWREAKVCGLLKATTVAERALLQAFPGKATDHLEIIESELGVAPSGSLEDRRRTVESTWVEALSATIPEIRAALQAIDPSIDVATLDADEAAAWQHGMHLAGDAPVFDATLNGAQWPNYGQHFIVGILWNGAPSGIPDPATRLQVERYLNRALPAWVDWVIFNRVGFYLDGFNDSRLDLTAFGAT